MKIGIVKGLVNSMQSFIKEQQKKLNNCLEKLDTLSKEIQKDEEKLNKGNKEEISQPDNENKDIKSSEKTAVRNGGERQGTNIQKSNEKETRKEGLFCTMLHDHPSERNELSHGNVFPEPAQEGKSRYWSNGPSQVFRFME